MNVPVVEGAKEKLAGAWAYLRSLPPHVWIGLVIGALALILAYLAWKNRNQGLSPLSDITAGSDPSSSLSPIADTGNDIIPPNDQSGYYNYNTSSFVPDMSKPVGKLPKFNAQIGYDIHNAAIENALKSLQRDAGAPAHGRDIHAAAKAASIRMDASAPAHGRDIHAAALRDVGSSLTHSYDIHAAAHALQKVAPIYKPPANIKGTGRHQDAGIY